MTKMHNPGYGRARLEYRVPSRALIGFRGEFLTSTRGTGLLNAVFDGWEPWGGAMMKRQCGAIVSDRGGTTTPYALHHLQPRGSFFLGTGVEVYEGMIVGEHNRPNDTDVNVTKEKKLTNVRNHGKDENVMLAPPRVLTSRPRWSGSTPTSSSRSRRTPCACASRSSQINKRPRRTDAIEDAQSVT